MLNIKIRSIVISLRIVSGDRYHTEDIAEADDTVISIITN